MEVGVFAALVVATANGTVCEGSLMALDQAERADAAFLGVPRTVTSERTRDAEGRPIDATIGLPEMRRAEVEVLTAFKGVEAGQTLQVLSSFRLVEGRPGLLFLQHRGEAWVLDVCARGPYPTRLPRDLLALDAQFAGGADRRIAVTAEGVWSLELTPADGGPVVKDGLVVAGSYEGAVRTGPDATPEPVGRIQVADTPLHFRCHGASPERPAPSVVIIQGTKTTEHAVGGGEVLPAKPASCTLDPDAVLAGRLD